MNNKDLRSLTEAYEQIFLKENEMEDLSKQDPREGFPTHEQDRHENDEEYDEESDEESDDDEPSDMSDVDADADTLASAGWGTDEDYGGYEESLADCYNRVMIEEAKKSVSAKGNINPWAVENALEKKTGKHFSKEKKEKIVKGIKMGAKKTGKKITSKPVKKK
jgi:hypothetical protein